MAVVLVIFSELHAFGIMIFPKITLVLTFLVMAVVLVIRPYGLLGRPPTHPRAAGPLRPVMFGPAPPALVRLAVAGVAAAVVLPMLGGDYARIVATEMAILVLFAASLHFMMGPGGLASFGHAAYFGVGAYAGALLLKHFGAPMEVGLLAAPLAAGLAGLLVGFFVVRLEGVYLAMLTLAFAQIAWSAAFQWVEVTGGDNGILGVWPSAWAQDKRVYYLFALVLCVGGTLALRHAIHSPFGFALRAARDNATRAEAIGIDVARVRCVAFAVASAFAGVAGALFAYAKGSVFPTYLAIPKSVDALLMVLLGGIETLSGPIVGALVFHGLQENLVRFVEQWRAAMGLVVIALVLAFPQGIAGFVRDRFGDRR
jgi:branched-chain amino acid transport system permease protein